MRKFDLLEQFETQDAWMHEAKQKYIDNERAAAEHVQNLKSQLEAEFSNELKSGKPSTNKAKLRVDLEKAEKDYQEAQHERVKAFEYYGKQGGKIKSADVVQAYLHEYSPAVKSEVLTSISEKMQQAKELYYSALLDFFNHQDEYRELIRTIKHMDQVAHQRGESPYTYAIDFPVKEADLKQYEITDTDIYFIRQHRKLPNQ